MQSLYNSNRVQTELSDFYKRLANIKDEHSKNEINSLIKQLMNEIKKIDSCHQEIFANGREPMILSETRNNIVKLRKQINSRLDHSSN